METGAQAGEGEVRFITRTLALALLAVTPVWAQAGGAAGIPSVPLGGKPDLLILGAAARFVDFRADGIFRPCRPDETPVVFHVQVRNAGTAAVTFGPSAAALLAVHDRVATWRSSTRYAGALDRGETRELLVALPYFLANPALMWDGVPHLFRLRVDPEDQVDELNEGNNEIAVTVDRPPNCVRPDLTIPVGRLVWNPQGDSAAEVTVANAGLMPVREQFTVVVDLSWEGEPTVWRRGGATRYVPVGGSRLTSGAAVSLSVRVRHFEDAAYRQGRFTARAVVDPERTVEELNEGNNTLLPLPRR